MTKQPPSASLGDNSSDDDLMSAIAGGNERAIQILYDRYASFLFALAMRVVRNDAEAQAVLSDVFWQVWQKAADFNPKVVGTRILLITLTRSRAIDRWRATTTRQRIEDDAGRSRGQLWKQDAIRNSPESTAILSEQGELVRTKLKCLTDAQRVALELAYYEGLTHVQIAERMKLPLGTVKSHIRQGIIALRTTLQKTSEEGTSA